MKNKSKMTNLIIFWVTILGVSFLSLSKCYGQATHASFGAGILEESRNLGVGIATSASLHQEVYKNLGVSAIYTYGFLQTGYADLYIVDGDKYDILSQPRPGSKFQQLQLMVNYKFYTNDEKIAIKPNVGIARQISGGHYPTFGLDLIAFPKSNIFPYLSWSPVLRDAFSEGKGWSHTVTFNLSFKL